MEDMSNKSPYKSQDASLVSFQEVIIIQKYTIIGYSIPVGKQLLYMYVSIWTQYQAMQILSVCMVLVFYLDFFAPGSESRVE